jgi:hypothetical protein
MIWKRIVSAWKHTLHASLTIFGQAVHMLKRRKYPRAIAVPMPMLEALGLILLAVAAAQFG